ncbi:MAG: FAD-dependent oxidoreductase, partial [Deltaproteobacteria bacterium]|nr:FAD-dependent oxidoreductase [Deltaproteobacteria bacterium]
MMTGGLTKEEESAGSSLFSGLKDENATDIPIKWDEVADVVIIGSGFAGLAAAIEAKRAGSSVIVIEKRKVRGGNSMISGGVVAAAGSPLQKRKG